MSLLTFLRQYGAREYGVTLAVAAVAGLAVAVLINSVPGGGGAPALLKTAPQEVAKTIAVKPKVLEPVRDVKRAVHRAPARHHRRHHRHSAAAGPAPRVVPVVHTAPKPASSTRTEVSAPAPVVRAPAPTQNPAPAPKPVPKRAPSKKSGGGIQFDDSG